MSHEEYFRGPNYVGMRALPCIICHKRLDGTFDEEGDDNHPDNGVVCTTRGNYGSTVFDNIDGCFLEFNVCDECLKRAAKQRLIALGFLGTLVGIRLRLWAPGLEDKYPPPEVKEKALKRSEELGRLIRELKEKKVRDK